MIILWVLQKKGEVRNRDWNFDQTGGLELRGDDAVQLKKRELGAERREDYNQYISQVQPVAVLIQCLKGKTKVIYLHLISHALRHLLLPALVSLFPSL